jgi:hypothetical protein
MCTAPIGVAGLVNANATQSGSRLESLLGLAAEEIGFNEGVGGSLGWCEAGHEQSLAVGFEVLVRVGCVYAASSVGTRSGRRRSGSR